MSVGMRSTGATTKSPLVRRTVSARIVDDVLDHGVVETAGMNLLGRRVVFANNQTPPLNRREGRET